MKSNESPFCKKCKSVCCHVPVVCETLPSDFGKPIEKLDPFLWTIKDKTHSLLIIVPKETMNTDRDKILFTCVFWRNNKGCVLPFKRRPAICRYYKPKKTKDGFCSFGAQKYKIDFSKSWEPHQRKLKALMKSKPLFKYYSVRDFIYREDPFFFRKELPSSEFESNKQRAQRKLKFYEKLNKRAHEIMKGSV